MCVAHSFFWSFFRKTTSFAESKRPRIFPMWKDDCKMTSVICNKPLTFLTEGTPGPSSVLLVTVTLLTVLSLVTLAFLRQFCRKFFSEPWSKAFYVLECPCFKHLRSFGHLRNEYCPFKHEKLRLLSATIFVPCVGVFSQNTGQRHKGCFFKAIQLVGRLSLSPLDGVWLELVDAKTLVPVFVLVTLAGGLLL